MKNTTLCYIRQGSRWLMLHRVKKKQDENAGKWIGVGGKLEENESPEECVLREVQEETGLTLTNWQYRGLVTFVSDRWEGEYMHLFTADGFTGSLTDDCPEGNLKWVEEAEIASLPRWAGDRLFWQQLQENPSFFSMKLSYRGDTLCEANLNGQPLVVE